MNCLLCQSEFQSKFKFTDLFLMKRECQVVCYSCQALFERLEGDLCQRCMKKSQDDICKDCLIWESKGLIVDHSSLFSYNEAMKLYFQKYKFQGDYLLRKVFTSEIKHYLKYFKGYVIVPVPVSELTYQERGFNQVEGLLIEAGIKYERLIIKEESEKQSTLNREERLKIKNRYNIDRKKEIPNKILLVDDIYTTGATINSIKTLLVEKGVKDVKTFSLCR